MYKRLHKALTHHYRTRYHGIYNHAKQLFVFDLVLLGFAIIMLGASIFFFLWKPGVAQLVEVSLTIGDQRVLSGEQIALSVHYVNHSKATLHDPIMALRVPSGFIINRSSTPESIISPQLTVQLPDSPPGSSGAVTVTGTFWIEPKIENKILATLSFRPDESTKIEQAIGALLLSLPASVLNGTLTVPTNSFAGTTLPVNYTLTNTGNQTLGPISLAHSTGLKFVSSTTNLRLDPGEQITLAGTLTLSNDPQARVTVTPLLTVANRAIRMGTAEQIVTIIAPNVPSEASLETELPYLAPGQAVPVTLHWQNSGTIALSQLTMHLVGTPSIIDLAKTARENHLTVSNNELIISREDRTALSSGKPGAEDTFTINLHLLPHFNLRDTDATTFTLQPVMHGTRSGVTEEFIQNGIPLVKPLATEVSLQSEVRYYTDEGDQLGRGPLPLVVGKNTRYWVFVRAANTTNPLHNPSLVVSLAPGVQFTGDQSVTIGPEMKLVNDSVLSWTYNELPPISQTGWYFAIAINPSPEMIGKSVELVRSIQFTATDDVTSLPITITHSAVKNILPATDAGSKKSSLVEAQ